MAPESPEQWRFTLAFPMLWAPDVDVKIRGDRHEDISITFEDILEGLDFGLMGEFYATRGPFGLAARFNYLDLRGEQSQEGLINTNLKLKMTAGVNDLLASWRVHDLVRLPISAYRQQYGRRGFDLPARHHPTGSDAGLGIHVLSQPPCRRGRRKTSASGGMLRSRMSR